MKRLVLLIPLLASGCGTDVSGPSASLISCALASPTALSTAAVAEAGGPENEVLCLTPGSSPGEFIYVPFFARAAPDDEDARLTLPVEVSGAGYGSVSGDPPAPAHARAEPPVALRGGGEASLPRPSRVPDPAFHDRLRRREMEELGPRIRPGGRAAAPGRAIADVPSPGDLLEFNVAVSCTERDMRTGRVMTVSEHAVVVADTATPIDLSPVDYAYFGVTFDTLVHPVETAHFGELQDIDGNGRSILFFTPAVNQRSDRSASSVVIGYFWSGDLFPEESTPRLEACPGGNDAEMFYLIAPDPTGAVGPAFSLQEVRDLAIPLIGHEYQHLVNASRRLFVNDAAAFEEPWLNEGLSHIAEELLFYEVAGLDPGQNINAEMLQGAEGAVAAFNEYMTLNFSNFRSFLSRPDTASLMNSDETATRGAIWSFLRYAADRSGRGDADFFFDLVNSDVSGLDNLRAVLAPERPLDWMRDWTVALYGDDRVPGLDPRFQTLSWNHRAVFEGSNVGFYPLRVLDLEPDRTTTVELLPGGAAYLRFAIPADERASIRAVSDGRTPPSTLRGSVLRVR